MYGHLSPGGVVGQLFREVPAEGTYHPEFLAAIVKLPAGITTGWRLSGGEWLPPEEEAPPELTDIEALRLRIIELTEALDALVGGGV